MAVSPSTIFEASERWVWIPADAPKVETKDYLLVRYPDSFESPFQLQRVNAQAEPTRVLDDVLEAAEELGAENVTVWSKLSAPRSLDAELVRRKAVHFETVSVLALDIRDRLPDLGDFDVAIEPVTDALSFAAYAAVNDSVFGGKSHVPAGVELDRILNEKSDGWNRGLGGELIARLNGTAVGIGGLTIAQGDARLWGGGVDRNYRGQGAYRALLHERLRYARELDASLAIVKGRIGTSAPILRRAGFAAFGEERAYRLPVPSKNRTLR